MTMVKPSPILVSHSILIGYVRMDKTTFPCVLKSVPTIQPNTRDVLVKMVLALGTKMVISAQLKIPQCQI